MSLRLLVLTEIISPYRIPVFNALANKPEITLHVVFLAENDPTEREWRVYLDEIRFSYQVLPSLRRKFGKRNLLLNRGVTAAASAFRPDVVLCGGYNYLASWQLMFWAQTRRKPFLLWMESNARDIRSGHSTTEWAKQYFIRRCNGIVVPGAAAAQYASAFGVSAKRIFLAPNAVDNDLFARNAEAARQNPETVRQRFSLPPRYILFVGRLVPEKGVFDLLSAYGKLASQVREEIGLVFVGDGVARRELVSQATAIASGKVCFLGFLQREDLGAVYGLADTLIFPSYSDPWGLVVNEAMACGLPVVATTSAGCVEDLVIDGENGRVVAPRDCDQLASAMMDLALNEGMRTSMGRRSLQIIRSYSPEKCASGIAATALKAVEFCREVDS